MVALEGDLKRLATDAVIFPADDCLIELTGADRRSWLQGQITQDLRNLDVWGSIKACLCTPTGQLLAALTIYDLEDRLLITTESSCVESVLKRGEEMVIMEDVSSRLLPYSLVSVQGPRAADHLEGSHLALAMDRSGHGGFDLWQTEGPSDLPEVSEEAAEVARIEAGIPRYGVDMGSRTLPPEMGPAFEAAHVSYTKGCYTGQEVLMRIHSRGHTNKTWVGFVLDKAVTAGARIGELGEVTSACISPRLGPIALGTVRNEQSTPGTSVQVGEATGIVTVLPF